MLLSHYQPPHIILTQFFTIFNAKHARMNNLKFRSFSVNQLADHLIEEKKIAPCSAMALAKILQIFSAVKYHKESLHYDPSKSIEKLYTRSSQLNRKFEDSIQRMDKVLIIMKERRQ